MTDLLPANSTPAERAISNAMARAWDIPAPAGLMWDPARIPAAYLPWLAWAVSVDHWDPDWPEATKRAAIAGSAAWHRIKGTRPAVVTALAQMGHPTATVTEDRDLPRYGDAGLTYGHAGVVFGPDDPSWADYWITLNAPALRPEALRIMARLAETAPARCRMRSVDVAPPHMLMGDPVMVYGADVTFGNVYYEDQPYG